MPNAVALMQDYKRPGELTARSDRRITRKPVKNLERPGTVKASLCLATGLASRRQILAVEVV